MKEVTLIEYSDLWMEEYVLSKAKLLYPDAKIETSKYPLRYIGGDPIYAIRITHYVKE